MSDTSMIDFAGPAERSAATQAAPIDSRTRSHASTVTSRDGAVEGEFRPRRDDDAGRLDAGLASRTSPTRAEQDEERDEVSLLLLLCGVLAAIAGLTFLRRLGVDLEALSSVLLALGLWRMLAAPRTPLDR
jgi:hypothetical protein